jgi:hypothetical protein
MLILSHYSYIMNLYQAGTVYTSPDIDPYSLSGSGVPKEARFFDASLHSYSQNPPKYLNPVNNNYRLILDTPTVDAYLNMIDNSILIGIRGTNVRDFQDLLADGSLIGNALKATPRYTRDKQIIQNLITQYPPEQHEYYITGHSLGMAIMSQLKRDFPFISYGVGYNGAYQPIDFLHPIHDIKRIYTNKDFLYNMGGRVFPNNTVVPSNNYIGAHSINNFEDMYKGQGVPQGRLPQGASYSYF